MKKYFLILLMMFSLIGCTADEIDEEKQNEVQVQHPIISFKIKGKDYTLPLNVEEFMNDGWVPEMELSDQLEPDTIVRNKIFRNGSYVVHLGLHNPTKTTVPMSEAFIAEISSENRSFGSDEASDIIVHDKISFASDFKDIQDALGAFSDKQESEIFTTYIFEHDSLSKTEIKIDKENGKIRWITVVNFRH